MMTLNGATLDKHLSHSLPPSLSPLLFVFFPDAWLNDCMLPSFSTIVYMILFNWGKKSLSSCLCWEKYMFMKFSCFAIATSRSTLLHKLCTSPAQYLEDKFCVLWWQIAELCEFYHLLTCISFTWMKLGLVCCAGKCLFYNLDSKWNL